jgi:hypothetical protein
MRARLRTIVTLAAALAFAAPAGRALAQPADESRPHIDKGTKLYGEGAYEAALIEFRRAYDLSGNYKILYNIALVSMVTKDFATALKDYQAYLQKGAAEIPAARRADVQKEIDKLVGLVAKLEVVGPEGAEVRVDDAPVGKLPLAAPLVLNPGKHKVTLAKDDRESPAKFVVIGAGEAQRVELSLPEKPAERPVDKPAAPAPPLAPVTAAPPPAPPKDEAQTPAWPFWAATGALAVGTGVMGGLTLSKYGALKTERDSAQTTTARLGDAASPVKTFAVVSDVLGAVTVVSLGVSIFMTVRKPGSPPPPAATAVRIGPGSVSLSGSF